MSRATSLALGALLGGLTSLPVIALFYLGKQAAGLPFVPFDLFDWLARVMPGGIITLFIDNMVRVITALKLGEISSVAKLMEQLTALAIAIAGGILFGVLIAWISSLDRWSGQRAGLLGGLLLFGFTAFMELSRGLSDNLGLALLWIAVLLLGWGALLGRWLTIEMAPEQTPEQREEFRAGRRALLVKITSSSVAITLVGLGLGRFLEEQRRATGAGQPLAGPVPSPVGAPNPTSPTAKVQPAPGTRPELPPTDQFYRIDIDLRPPSIVGSSWQMEVAGLFDNPRPITLSDLMKYPAVTQPITLACISNPVGGDLIGTGNWTGVRLMDLLKDLGLRSTARQLHITSADGFFESVEMADMQDPRVLLVYGMNGDTLPVEHGFPLRIYIPNRYGMKQPKWITRIEASDREQQGYWVERGWNREARPQIVSIIDTVAADKVENGRVPIGGIAWAGDRGIHQVEVQVDGGPWEAATLLPPLGPLTWTLWRYDWPRVAGQHSFRVRATDGTGALQIEEPSDTFPDGATGYHTVTRTI